MTIHPRKILAPIAASIAVLLLSACAAGQANMPQGSSPFCPGGVPGKFAPVVCVDDTLPNNGLEAVPDVTPVYRKNLDGKPVTIHWFTNSGDGDLSVRFKQAGCVTRVNCNGKGHCVAKTDPAGTATECKYDIFILGTPKFKDPTVVVEPCCLN